MGRDDLPSTTGMTVVPPSCGFPRPPGWCGPACSTSWAMPPPPASAPSSARPARARRRPGPVPRIGRWPGGVVPGRGVRRQRGVAARLPRAGPVRLAGRPVRRVAVGGGDGRRPRRLVGRHGVSRRRRLPRPRGHAGRGLLRAARRVRPVLARRAAGLPPSAPLQRVPPAHRGPADRAVVRRPPLPVVGGRAAVQGPLPGAAVARGGGGGHQPHRRLAGRCCSCSTWRPAGGLGPPPPDPRRPLGPVTAGPRVPGPQHPRTAARRAAPLPARHLRARPG